MIFILIICVILLSAAKNTPAAMLTVVLDGDDDVTLVGTVARWDQDGNPRNKIDPKAAIDQPRLDAKAVRQPNGKWLFKNLPPGKYDLVILGKKRLRIEGWVYASVLEFDPFFPPTATTTDSTRQTITDDIKKSRHYENRVKPLAMGGDDKTVRVLVILIRDLPTSYKKGTGTIRFEIWQYTNRYGAWVKEKRTRVMHRLLLQVDELRRWTWVWEPTLGEIEVKDEPVTVRYSMPKPAALKTMPGLHPY